MKGLIQPKQPREPRKVHQENHKEVPYTPEEQRVRAIGYNGRMKIWNKTMEVCVVLTCE